MNAGFPTRLTRAALLGLVVAQIANLAEGLTQAVVTFGREPMEWVHSVGIYAWVGLVAGLLLGLVLYPIERLVPIRLRGRLDVPLLVAGFGLAVGGYWLNLSPHMPSFTSAAGKLATAGFGLVVVVVAGLVFVLLGRRAAAREPSRSRSDVAGRWGLVLVGLIVLGLPYVSSSGSDPRGPEIAAAGGEVERPPIVVIMIDTLRRDHLGLYGYERDTSPRLDALAERSIVFEASNTTGNFTIPATASFFTGLYPSGHGIVHPHDRFPLDVPTVTERLRDAGYRTGAFVGNPTMRAEMGYARGFEDFYPAPPPRWIYHRKTAIELLASRLIAGGDVSPTPNLVDRALDWIRRDDDRPPFLYLHVMDPHSGYKPPREHFEPFLPPGVDDGPIHPPRLFEYYEDEWIPWEDLERGPELAPDAVAGMKARYDGEIHYVDMWIGRFLDALDDEGVLDGALVLVLSDHGEEFGEHGGWFHGDTLYQEMVGMPFVLKMPGNAYAGTRTRLQLDMVDIAPTLEGWTGLGAAPGRQGEDLSRSLLVVASGAAPLDSVQPRTFTFYERPPRLYGIDAGGLKFVRRVVQGTERVSMHALGEDPGEFRDLADEQPEMRMRMDAMIDSVLADVTRVSGVGADQDVDPETLRALRSLGYVE